MLENCKFQWTCCYWSHDRNFKGEKKLNFRDISRGSHLHWKKSSAMFCWCCQLRTWPEVSKGLFTLQNSKNLVRFLFQENQWYVPKTSLYLRPLARLLNAGSSFLQYFGSGPLLSVVVLKGQKVRIQTLWKLQIKGQYFWLHLKIDQKRKETYKGSAQHGDVAAFYDIWASSRHRLQ